MALVVLCLVGAAAEAAALGLLLRVRPMRWLVPNYRGARVIGRAGLTLGAPLLAAVALATALRIASDLPLLAATVSVAAFGALGWLDDTYGDSSARGMKGHLAALVKHRRVTTGLVKAVGGGIVGLWAAYLLGAKGWAVVPGGALIAVCANTVNVLDARPGRAVKAFLPVAAVLVVVGSLARSPAPTAVLAALLGGAAVFAWADLSERAMLGDTGANALGCALGIAAVGLSSWPVWLALSIALTGLGLAADRWSLTALIGRTPVLRQLDDLGRSPDPTQRGVHGN